MHPLNTNQATYLSSLLLCLQQIARSVKAVDTTTMVSLEAVQATSRCTVPSSSPRVSFSAEFLDENNFISICPNSAEIPKNNEAQRDKTRNLDFEFLSTNSTTDTMLTADELFFEGKLLPYWQIQYTDKLNKINLKPKEQDDDGEEQEQEQEKKENKEESRVNWFIDDDPSPRPPKCTVLWKELLRLKKQRASSLSPSSSSSSSSSSSLGSVVDACAVNEGKEGKEGRLWNREKHVKRIKKGLERTRSASVRIRPMINVPICTHVKNSGLPPLFSLKKGSTER